MPSDCGKQWQAGRGNRGPQFPTRPDRGRHPEVLHRLRLFRQVAKELKHRFSIHETDVSPETIRHWVDSYTDAAIKLFQYSIAHRGTEWGGISENSLLHCSRP